MIEHSFVLTSKLGEPIRGTIRYQETDRKLPVVIVSHGFKGFKDWGFHPYLGQQLAENGYCAIHYNFSRCGVGEDLLNFTELDKFKTNTFSVELDDLQQVIDALDNELAEHPVDWSRIGLAGHSRGGGIAIIKAREEKRVKCLVTWSSVATYERYDQTIIDDWQKKGYLEIMNARTGQVMQMGVELMDDYLVNRERLNIETAAASLHVPFCIIHGAADETVSFSEAETLYQRAKNQTTVHLEAVENAGHTFGAKHPWAGTTPQLERAIQTTIHWFDEYL